MTTNHLDLLGESHRRRQHGYTNIKNTSLRLPTGDLNTDRAVLTQIEIEIENIRKLDAEQDAVEQVVAR